MTTYVYGKLTKTKFFTPNRAYTHSTSFPVSLNVNSNHPCLITKDSVQVFYNSPVFNSYVTVFEEEVSKLYSVDGKTTIIRSKVDLDTLYTFRVIEETKSIRVCELMKYDEMLWVGRNTYGKLLMSNRKCEVNTPIGRGECILQNNKHPKTIKVKLWKVEDENLFFVEIDNPIKDSIEVHVDEIKDNCMRVFVKEELLGFYIFGVSSDLVLNSFVEVSVLGQTDDKLILKYQDYTGFIKLNNVDPEFFSSTRKSKSLKGRIIEIKGGQFELSQEQKISVPFDIDDPEISSESVDLEDNALPNIDTLSDILNLIKKLTENKKYDEVHETYYKYINTLSSNDRDNLSIVYCNFLEYIGDDVVKEIKKISKHCTDKFIEKVGLSSTKDDVIEYCYNKIKTRDLYAKYLEMCYQTNKEIKNYPYMDIAVDMIYKYENNPRIEVEKIIGNSKCGWMAYLENEKDEYKRLLFRRVVNLKWKVSDMKEWYRMWMNFEKEEGGNVDEVRSRAKEFVESVKNKA
ncbi:hypothetical protein P3W45_000197 [Vairimorpha bombi]